MGNTIQVNYEQLEQIEKRFATQAEATTNLQQRLRELAEDLGKKGWSGEAATAFNQEMETVVFPALQKLITAFQHSSESTQHIAGTFHEAEEQLKSTFGANGSQQPVQMPASGPAEGETIRVPEGADSALPGQTENFDFEGEVVTGSAVAPAIRIQQRWSSIDADIKAGDKILEKLMKDPVAMVKENVELDWPGPIVATSVNNTIAKGTIGFLKEWAAITKVPEVAAQRTVLYDRLGQGIGSALDPENAAPEPNDPMERAFYEIGKRSASSLSPLEKYQLGVALIDYDRTYGFEGFDPINKTPAYFESRFDASSMATALHKYTASSKYQYR